jgi:SagB-type dehydrogenase family enzyme
MKIPFFSQRRNISAASISSMDSSRESKTPAEIMIDYHEQTKHHYHRFARSLGYLDWDTQPNPFRRFEGSNLLHLPLLSAAQAPTYEHCLEPKAISPEPVSLVSISRFFRNSLAISAWKRYQEARWALRVNPSSGNLHPTEGYAILDVFDSQKYPGVYHYTPQEHALEQRAKLSGEAFEKLTREFPARTFFVGFTSIHWREAWKYGERAFRYCQHDLGHAIAAVRISAAVLGWQFVLLDELSTQEIAVLLGLDRTEDFHEAEDEFPHCIGAVVPFIEPIPGSSTIRHDAIADVASSEWMGHANRLSINHMEWEIIDEVARHSIKERTAVINCERPPILESGQWGSNACSAEQIIQQRRSAVAMDGKTSISSEVFFSMLSRVMPGANRIPFDALVRSEIGIPRVHLALFVLRVNGLDSGLYMLVREKTKTEQLKEATSSQFLWLRPTGCPPDLPLYCLQRAEVHQIAAGVSCGQAIAGDGAFSLGMFAEFEEPLKSNGPQLYPRLFWETGIIGQILYLEAEAAGLRATGIGCFFDDPMHETFGLKGRQFQSLYHFTVGGPVEDTRLTTEAPYAQTHIKFVNPDLP